MEWQQLVAWSNSGWGVQTRRHPPVLPQALKSRGSQAGSFPHLLNLSHQGPHSLSTHCQMLGMTGTGKQGPREAVGVGRKSGLQLQLACHLPD